MRTNITESINKFVQFKRRSTVEDDAKKFGVSVGAVHKIIYEDITCSKIT